MPCSDYFIMMCIGGFFVILGIILIFLGKGEARHYYESTADRADAREFLEHWPQRPRVGAVKIGGWIALAVGVVLAVVGGAFWLWG
jgi:NADH:ubiquinone oxidoreductase subunit 5 (subunit L)/multisubunit Na+/H+ antiporter MnhA subunit